MVSPALSDQRVDVLRLRAEIDQLTIERDRNARRLEASLDTIEVLRAELDSLRDSAACPTCKLAAAETARWKRVATELNDRLLTIQKESVERDATTTRATRLVAW